MKHLISLFLVTLSLLLSACGGGGNSVQTVSVHSLGPVLRAVVSDANGQVAVQSVLQSNVYTFDSAISYPVMVTGDGVNSYIDIDYDGVRSGADIDFNTTLYSVGNVVTELTTVLLEASDINASMEYNATKYAAALADMQSRFSLSDDQITSRTPVTAARQRLAVLSDTLFYEKSDGNFTALDLSLIQTSFSRFEQFYTEYLGSYAVTDAAKYHSQYLGLQLLDMKRLNRAQRNMMPTIPAFMNSDYADTVMQLNSDNLLSSAYNRYDLAYWDIAIDSQKLIAYVASGNDGLDTVDISSPQQRLDNQEHNVSGFGTSVIYTDRADSRCVFLADQSNQVQVYGLWPLSHAADPGAMEPAGSYVSAVTDAKSFDVDYISTNAGQLELLLVANGAAGVQMVDFGGITCEETVIDLNDTALINSAAIGNDTYSVVASSNKKVVYAADGVNGLISIDISGAAPEVIETVALDTGVSAYDLHMVGNSNELFVSTSEGVQIYNTDESGNMRFQGAYMTEGSRTNTLGETLKVFKSANNRALFVADITGGMKVLDISDSSDPKLCGVAYFKGANVAERSAVRDVVLQENASGEQILYIANDSNGLIRIPDARDVLFAHCKTLLD